MSLETALNRHNTRVGRQGLRRGRGEKYHEDLKLKIKVNADFDQEIKEAAKNQHTIILGWCTNQLFFASPLKKLRNTIIRHVAKKKPKKNISKCYHKHDFQMTDHYSVISLKLSI